MRAVSDVVYVYNFSFAASPIKTLGGFFFGIDAVAGDDENFWFHVDYLFGFAGPGLKIIFFSLRSGIAAAKQSAQFA